MWSGKLNESAVKQIWREKEQNCNVESGPCCTLMSIANHNISWLHNSNNISLSAVRLKYNEVPPFTFFFQPQRAFKSVIYTSETCRYPRDCQSSQINLLITIWLIRCWPFTDSDLIVAWIRFITSGLHWNWQIKGLQIQYISQTKAHYVIQSL